MSLYERAQKVANPNMTRGQIVGGSGVADMSAAAQRSDLSILHEQVSRVISTDKLAEIVCKSPARGMAEIRSAAGFCFSDEYWVGYEPAEKQKLIEQLIDFMFGFGPIESFLDDPTITEVMVNGSHSIFYERDGVLHKADVQFNSDEQVRALIDRILGPLGRRIDEASPTVNARLMSGHRVHAIIPPLALDGPVLTIRKFTERVMLMSNMIEVGSFDERVQSFLRWCVLLRKNIAVSGGTGSGKTTLLNALSCEIPFSERIITIEDSAELRFLEHPHVVRLEARPQNAEGNGEVTIRDLVINALRMRPDRIVVGECRGSEALDMLQAMNTGHDGSLTTLHANSSIEAISRLTTMVRYAAELPVDVIEAYIASAIDIVIQTARGVDGSRYISEIVEFSYDIETKKCVTDVLFRRGAFDSGAWVHAPEWIDTVCDYKHASKQEVETWKCSIS